MFLHTVHSEGLGHLSYIVGDGNEAAVIDPRRDVDVYLDLAGREGARITHIFETHRNEDYVSGSCELAHRTGAEICHGEGLDFGFGASVGDGDRFTFGDARLSVIATPGHTFESISLALADSAFADEPIGVFTGDALFIGDVGRTDFYPERAEEVAGLLHRSLFEKLLPLGDHVIVYPAHGAGSICGSAMASREFSTLGYERRHNPLLQLTDRADFVRRKLAEHHYQPPYFQKMEALNRDGPPLLANLPRPGPMTAEQFADALGDGMIALDIRSPEAFAGAFIPGSLAIPRDMIPGFAGWFLPYGREIGLIAAGPGDVEPAVRHLVRLGYDRVAGYLDEGLHTWEITGRDYGSVPALHAAALKSRIEGNEAFTLLDVRGADEIAAGRLPNSVHIYLGELPDKLEDIPRERPITTFCGSGQRAIVAASILRRAGFDAVEVCLGSMAACRAIGCEIVTP